MAHRVAAWESMPWEAVEAVAVPSVEKRRATYVSAHAGGRGNASLHMPLRVVTPLSKCHFVTSQVGFPPFVESRPVTGP